MRLIGADGEQVGIVATDEALKRARAADLDLVEVAADAKPPVARLLDYSKYKYEQEQKQKAARKHQQQVNVREIKLRPKIAAHDYNTKKGHVERFLRGGDKVKVTIMFRGREQAHPDRGRDLLHRLYEDLGEIAVIEQQPLQEGRNMSMLVAPTREASLPKPSAEESAKAAAPAEPDAEAAAEPAADAKVESAAEPAAKAKAKAKAKSAAEKAPVEQAAAEAAEDAAAADEAAAEPAEEASPADADDAPSTKK